MPCKDVSERLTVTIDDDDRLVSYRFIKRTCGRGVGVDDLLSGYLVGQQARQILAITPDQCLEETGAPEGIEEFLALKHLVAIQAALESLLGLDARDDDGFCMPLECVYDGQTTMEASIRVDLVTERIKSCGGCKGCGTKRAKRRKTPALAR